MSLFLKDYLRKYFWENFKWFNEKGVRETVGSYLKEKYWDLSEKKVRTKMQVRFSKSSVSYMNKD